MLQNLLAFSRACKLYVDIEHDRYISPEKLLQVYCDYYSKLY